MRTLLLAATISVLLAPPGHGATFQLDFEEFQVDADSPDVSPGDGVCADDHGRCTLRAAIDEANALPGPDVILARSGEEIDAKAPYHITDDVSIEEPYSRNLVNGPDFGALPMVIYGRQTGGTDPLFVVDSGSAAFVGLDVWSGPGGGIVNHGTLTLTRSEIGSFVSGSASRAIENTGTLSLVESVVRFGTAADSGGGILNLGTLTITGSTLQDNTANDSCGALDNQGTASIVNSTITRNGAGNTGGGLCNRQGGVLEVSSSTITANTAPNGAGIENEDPGSTLTIRNTIVSDNTGPDCGDDGAATLVARGRNLVGASSVCTVTGPGTVITGPADVGPLQFNGGPTRTHAARPTSLAIDAADPAPPGSGGDACPAVDQRGMPRPQDTACDIGAVEGPEVACLPTLRPDCDPSARDKGPISVRPGKLFWHWDALFYDFTGFGDPAATTTYRFCFYDRPGGTPRAFLGLLVPAGALCRGLPCWSERHGVLRYNDPTLAADGMRRIYLVPGLDDGRIKVQAKGPALAALPLPLSPPATVQLLNSDGYCWTADYSTLVTRNTATRFTAHSDGP